MIKIGFKKLNKDAVLPVKAHETDSGFDLVACENVVIKPGETVIVPTGIAVQLPEGYEAQIRPRSGVTLKTKLRVQLGTIDNDYRGEIGIIVDNISPIENKEGDSGRCLIDGTPERYITETYEVRKGDRIAQLVIQKLTVVETIELDELDESDRGVSGFGSSGTKAF